MSSRSEARDAGESKYSTGKPCARGHTAERYTNTALCVECRAEDAQKYTKAGGNVKIVAYVDLRDESAVKSYVEEINKRRRGG